MKLARDAGEFTRRGFRAREFFQHEVLWLPKPSPDAYLNLERRGIARERVLAAHAPWLGRPVHDVHAERSAPRDVK